MSFTLSGSTITQSGTDTSYAGLNGIAGVTRILTGDGYLYYMPTLILSITGTLTIANPSNDSIVCAKLSVSATGNFTSGSFGSDGVTPLRSGTHFQCVSGEQGPDSFNFGGSLQVGNGGRFTTVGGQYILYGGVHYQNGAIIREYSTDVVAAADYGLNSIRIRAYSSDVVKRNCRHFDMGYDMFRMPSEFSVKGFKCVYVSQYVGATQGYPGAHAKFTAYALSNNDGSSDFDNWGAGWVELYNSAKGATLVVNNSATRTTYCVPLYQDVNIKVTNLSGVVQNNVRYKFTDAPVSNSPTTTITTEGGLKTWDFRNPITYQGITNASGVSTVSPVLQVWHGASNLKNLRFPASTATMEFRAYALVSQQASIVLGSDTAQALPMAMTAINYLALTEAQALALTGITFTPSGANGGTISVSSARPIAELWQYYRAWISQFANFSSNDTWTYDGTNLNIGAWTITGIENLSGGKITTSSATASGSFTIGIVGNVTQATPTNLSGVSIAGNLIYNSNSDITVTLTNCTISGTVSNSRTSNVKFNLINSTVNTGANVTAQYPITVTDANGANFSTQIWVFNSLGNIVEDTGFLSLVANMTVYMPVGGSIRVYSQAYGTLSKITNTNATNASLVITHIPETLVDTSLPIVTRDLIASYFSSIIDGSLLYVEVDTDLVSYTPAEVLNGMHYFIVSNGGNFAALSLLANSVGSVQLIDGGFRVYSPFFKGRAKSTLNSTSTPSLFITLPLYIEDASGVQGNQIMIRNVNGIDVHSALWSKATAYISQNDMDSIAGTTWRYNGRTLNGDIFE